MPTPLKLDKSWRPTLKRLAVRGSVVRVQPTVSFGILDSATGTLMARVYAFKNKADDRVANINARRQASLGEKAPLVSTVTITTT